MATNEQLVCSICFGLILAEDNGKWKFGHNADPVNNGRCCRRCNDRIVLPARIRQHQREQRANRVDGPSHD